MSAFTIAAAQSSSVKGDLAENIRRHTRFDVLAAEHGADVIVFPELSLTGYEPTIASEMALASDDKVLDPLKALAEDSRVTIIAGCPIRSTSGKPFIGALIFRPGHPISVYRKRFVHHGEEPYFSASNDTVVCPIHGESIGVAICADISHAIHPADARRQAATIYAAGVLMTPSGVGDAEASMSSYAKEHRMLTVMANHASPSGGYPTAGRSAVWSQTGETLARAAGEGEWIVLASKTSSSWTGSVVACRSA